MKRDWSLLLCILAHIESETLAEFLSDAEHSNWEEGQTLSQRNAQNSKRDKELRLILLHLKLLIDGRFVTGVIIRVTSDGHLVYGCAPEALLTNQGYDLLESLRQDSFWERIKKTAKEKALPLTFDAVKELSAFIIKQTLG